MQLQNFQMLLISDICAECDGLETIISYMEDLNIPDHVQYMVMYKEDLLDALESFIDHEEESEVSTFEKLEKILSPFDNTTMIALQ